MIKGRCIDTRNGFIVDVEVPNATINEHSEAIPGLIEAETVIVEFAKSDGSTIDLEGTRYTASDDGSGEFGFDGFADFEVIINIEPSQVKAII